MIKQMMELMIVGQNQDIKSKKMLNNKNKSILIYALTIFFFITSCATFHPDSKYNNISSSGKYIQISNPKIKIQLLSYGDFVYANNKKEYKKLYNEFNSIHSSPKKLILYAATTEPQYHYYIFQSKSIDSSNSKTISCFGKHLTIQVEKLAPQKDIDFLLSNFKCKE